MPQWSLCTNLSIANLIQQFILHNLLGLENKVMIIATDVEKLRLSNQENVAIEFNFQIVLAQLTKDQYIKNSAIHPLLMY